MFTEDDDKVVVKKEPNGEYDNIYAPFMKEQKKKNKKTVNNKKKKVEEKKEPSDNSNFYSSFLEQENDNEDNTSKKKKKQESLDLKTEDDYQEVYNAPSNPNKKNIFKIITFALEIIVVVVLAIILISKLTSKRPNIVLDIKESTINIGESITINYSVINTDKKAKITYSSSNQNVAAVDNFGQVTGVSAGEADIIVSFDIEGRTGNEKCKITVNNKGVVNKNISLDLRFENGKDDTWTNKDVSILVISNSIYGIASLQYTVNCDNNCQYKNVPGSGISITNEGISKVTVKAKDKNNQEASKTVTVKIDKQAPSITFNEGNTITANNSKTVCATCKDSASGCAKDKVCVKYTSSRSNQRITVTDNAGNKAYSPTFNVKINKNSVPACSLSVSGDGTITATVTGNPSYYGFSSSYSGTNQKTQNANIKGSSGAKFVRYYVKNSSGVKGSCSITVIKTDGKYKKG